MKNLLYIFISLVLIGCTVEEELCCPTPYNADYLNPDLTYGSVTDCSGNTYATIEIGTQEWMAENLRTSCYANGDSIPATTNYWEVNPNEGGALTGSTDSDNVFGCLYNGFACTDIRNLYPTGWHVASDSDWFVLENYLDPSISDPNATGNRGEVAAGYLKSEWYNITFQGWADLSESSNISGFSALPNGMYDGTFRDGGKAVYWSLDGDTSSVSRRLEPDEIGIERRNEIDSYFRNYYSVRCIKD